MSGRVEDEIKAPPQTPPRRRKTADNAPTIPSSVPLDPLVMLCSVCCDPFQGESPRICPTCRAQLARIGDAFEREEGIRWLVEMYKTLAARIDRGADVITGKPSGQRQKLFTKWRYMLGNVERVQIMLRRLEVEIPDTARADDGDTAGGEPCYSGGSHE